MFVTNVTNSVTFWLRQRLKLKCLWFMLNRLSISITFENTLIYIKALCYSCSRDLLYIYLWLKPWHKKLKGFWLTLIVIVTHCKERIKVCKWFFRKINLILFAAGFWRSLWTIFAKEFRCGWKPSCQQLPLQNTRLPWLVHLWGLGQLLSLSSVSTWKLFDLSSNSWGNGLQAVSEGPGNSS